MAQPATLSDLERKLVLRVVGSYPELCKSDPSSWAVFNDDCTESRAYLEKICHADMSRETSNMYDHMFTAVPRDDDASLDYIRWLIDRPFVNFKAFIDLECVDVDGDLKYYVRLSKLDSWPANVVFDFCIATRVPIEYPAFCKYWAQAVKAGVDPSLAFLVVSRVCFARKEYKYVYDKKPDGDDPWDWKVEALDVPPGHFWFDLTANWNNILKGEMLTARFTSPYKKRPLGVRPCNNIWGMERRDNKLVGKTIRELSAHFGLETP